MCYKQLQSFSISYDENNTIYLLTNLKILILIKFNFM